MNLTDALRWTALLISSRTGPETVAIKALVINTTKTLTVILCVDLLETRNIKTTQKFTPVRKPSVAWKENSLTKLPIYWLILLVSDSSTAVIMITGTIFALKGPVSVVPETLAVANTQRGAFTKARVKNAVITHTALLSEAAKKSVICFVCVHLYCEL